MMIDQWVMKQPKFKKEFQDTDSISISNPIYFNNLKVCFHQLLNSFYCYYDD